MSGEFVLDGRFVEQWRAAGLGGELVDILDAYQAKIGNLRDGEDDERHAALTSRRDRVRSLVHGAPAKKVSALPAGSDYRTARAEVERATMRALRGLGDRLITEQLAPAHEALLAEAAPFAEQVDGLRDDTDVVRRADSEGRMAWSRLAQLWEAREALVELLRPLIRDKVVPTATRRASDDPEEWRLFRHPSRGAAPEFGGVRRVFHHDPHAVQPAGARLMADLVLDEHNRQPGLFTADELTEHVGQDADAERNGPEVAYAEAEARRREERRANRADRVVVAPPGALDGPLLAGATPRSRHPRAPAHPGSDAA